MVTYCLLQRAQRNNHNNFQSHLRRLAVGCNETLLYVEIYPDEATAAAENAFTHKNKIYYGFAS